MKHFAFAAVCCAIAVRPASALAPMSSSGYNHRLSQRQLQNETTDESFDYIVIGGGPAGFVIAEQLSEDPNVSVMLLEAGPENAGVRDIDVPILAPLLLRTKHAFNYTSTPDPNLGGVAPVLDQGRGFGGGSAINYMGHCRGAPSLFDQWAEISGDDGLRWENFLQSFRAIYNYQSITAPSAAAVNASVYGDGPVDQMVRNDNLGSEDRVIEAFRSQLDLPLVDMNAGNGIGVSAATLGIRPNNLTRDFAPQAFGWRMAGRPNAQMLFDAEVTKINFEALRAVSVDYANPNEQGGEMRTMRGREIILSAGAISSPRVLMLSGVGPRNHLRQLNIPLVADIDQVGKNLLDHHHSHLEYEVTNDVETLWQYNNNDTARADYDQQYAQNPATGPLGVPNGAAFACYRAPDAVFADVNSTFHTDLPDDRGQLLLQYGTSNFQAQDNYTNVISPFVAVSQPEGSGEMYLASANWRDPPVIESNYYGTPSDKAAILHGYKQIRAAFAQPAVAPIIVREIFPGSNVTSDEDLWTAIQQSATSFHHPVGTVALGSVLEGRTFRVNGLQGLRVVDSSAMPYSTTCHPMASVYALAYHAAQNIKAQDLPDSTNTGLSNGTLYSGNSYSPERAPVTVSASSRFATQISVSSIIAGVWAANLMKLF